MLKTLCMTMVLAASTLTLGCDADLEDRALEREALADEDLDPGIPAHPTSELKLPGNSVGFDNIDECEECPAAYERDLRDCKKRLYYDTLQYYPGETWEGCNKEAECSYAECLELNLCFDYTVVECDYN